MNEEYTYQTITPIAAKLLGCCLILFLVLFVLSILSIILNIKRKNKKIVIVQIVLSGILLFLSYYIVGNSICLFGINSDLYLGLFLVILGNILTLINTFKNR